MRWFFINLAILVAVFRVVLLLTSFNEHIESSYEALAHGLTFGLLGWWLREDENELSEFNWSLAVLYVISFILVSPIIFLFDECDPPSKIFNENWPIFVVTGLTWTEIICATASILS